MPVVVCVMTTLIF